MSSSTFINCDYFSTLFFNRIIKVNLNENQELQKTGKNQCSSSRDIESSIMKQGRN